MPEVHTVHCKICGKAISGTSFGERMAKLRHHRKLQHPTAHKKSVGKSVIARREKVRRVDRRGKLVRKKGKKMRKASKVGRGGR